MKEYTFVIDAQITVIGRSDTDIIEAVDKWTLAKQMKHKLGADDVTVGNIQMFISKEEE